MDLIIESGVDILKIEGRTKGADYVQVVTQCYREALQSVHENDFTEEKVKEWKAALSKVYNRGFWEGYYLGRKLGEWTPHPGSAATEKKTYIGKGSGYYAKISVAEFIIESGSLKAGDALMITGPRIGMARERVEKLIVNGTEASEAVKGDKVTFPFATKVTPQDQLYKIKTTDSHA